MLVPCCSFPRMPAYCLVNFSAYRVDDRLEWIAFKFPLFVFDPLYHLVLSFFLKFSTHTLNNFILASHFFDDLDTNFVDLGMSVESLFRLFPKLLRVLAGLVHSALREYFIGPDAFFIVSLGKTHRVFYLFSLLASMLS